MYAHRTWISMLLLIAAFVLAACESSPRAPVAQTEAADPPPLPTKAVTENAAVAIWIDTSQFTPEIWRAYEEQIYNQMAENHRASKQHFDQEVEGYAHKYQSRTEAGVKGTLLLAELFEEDNGYGSYIFMEHTRAETTAEDLKNVHSLAHTDGFTKVGPGWFVGQEQQDKARTTGTEAQAQEIGELFSHTHHAPVRIAFRMTPAIDQKFQQWAHGGDEGPDNPRQTLAERAQSLNAGWGTVTIGEDPSILITLRLDNAEAAAQFNTAWNDVLAQLQQQLVGVAQMLSNSDNPDYNEVNPRAVRRLIDMFRLEQADQTLTVQIDQKKLVASLFDELAPLPMLWFWSGGRIMQAQQDQPGPDTPQP